jgi:tetratricopeptide (TPR) repeat protein
VTGRVIPFPQREFSSEEARAAANRILSLSVPERIAKRRELQLEEPDTLIEICRALRGRLTSSPSKVCDEAVFLFGFLSEPRRSIGLFDEREYFIGEAALLAGTACRLLARREEALRWLERSETSFRLTVNPVANWSRVSYQRLAMRLEERRFEELLEQLPGLIESFAKEDMSEDALKCRFLEALALMETGELDSAAEAFQSICAEAKRLRNDTLVATACANLVQVFGMLGRTEEALECSREAVPLFQAADNKFGLAKVQCGMGALLRGRCQYSQAVDAYRDAQERFLELGMLADVAAGNLIVADLLLEMGQEAPALKEILRALPVIDELKMVPEGVAALSLLRESVRQQRINRQALRDLHGYFEDLK